MPPKMPRAAAPADAPSVRVRVQRGDLSTTPSELVVVGAFDKAEEFHGVTGAVDEAIGGMLARVLATGDFKGKLKETLLVHPPDAPAKRVLLVGLGEVNKFTVDRARRVSAIVARRARDLGVERCHSAIHGLGSPGVSLGARELAEAMAEGALLGLYRFQRYKGKKDEEKAKEEAKRDRLREIVLVDKGARQVAAAEGGAAWGATVAECTNMCRDWAQWSGEDAAPERYGERAKELARADGLKVDVFDKAKIAALGMGGLLAVAQGSVREPRFVALEHDPRGAKRTVVLVGKGITFDSGGISIKPGDGMETMKMDKCGASAVVAACVAAARLKLPLRVVAIAAFTDNLPSGSAYKPGDVVRTMSGKTIEIINTDAEGRVILADALHYGARYEPDAMVELSTLTGGCIIAVGHHCVAAMGNSDGLLDQLRAAGLATNERVWPMPFFDEYGEMVKSKVADVMNSTGRVASSITAGKFLENFVGDHPWAHLDIASTAYHGGPAPKLNEEYCPEMATGVGVRLLVEWMRHFKAPTWEKKKDPKGDEKKPARAVGARKKLPAAPNRVL